MSPVSEFGSKHFFYGRQAAGVTRETHDWRGFYEFLHLN